MKRLLIIPLILIILLLCGGCSENREQYTRLMVQSMALDRTDVGYQLTILAFKADGSQGMLTNGTEAGNMEHITAEGESVYAAIRNVSRLTGLTPFYAHNNGIIFGEELAREGIGQALETFSLYTEMRPSTHVFVCRGMAAELVQKPKEGEAGNSRQLHLLAESGSENGRMASVNMKEAVALHARRYSDVYIPLIAADDDGKPVEDGTAVFSDGKLSGFFDEEETRGLMLLLNSMQRGAAVVKQEKSSATFELSRCESSVSAEMQSGRPTINITVKMRAELYEGGGSQKYGTADMETARESVEQYMRECITRAISRGLEYKSDVFGFGQRLYMRSPAGFPPAGTDWREALREADYTIRAEADMREPGSMKDA